MTTRAVHVYQIDIEYPEGSREPGWRPACWSDARFLARLGRRGRRKLAAAEFRWPRERMFLSSSGAYERAWMLRSYGATAEVRRSLPVVWPECMRDDCDDAMLGFGDPPVSFDSSGIPLGHPGDTGPEDPFERQMAWYCAATVPAGSS